MLRALFKKHSVSKNATSLLFLTDSYTFFHVRTSAISFFYNISFPHPFIIPPIRSPRRSIVFYGIIHIVHNRKHCGLEMVRMPSYRNKCSRLRVISWLGFIPVTQLDQLYLSYKTGLFEARVPLKTCCFQVHNDGVHKTRVFLFEYYQLARNARVRRTKLETKSLRPMISIPNVTDPFIICTHVWYTRLSSCQPCILVQ